MSTTSRVGSNEVKIEGKKRKFVSEQTHVTLKVKGQVMIVETLHFLDSVHI